MLYSVNALSYRTYHNQHPACEPPSLLEHDVPQGGAQGKHVGGAHDDDGRPYPLDVCLWPGRQQCPSQLQGETFTQCLVADENKCLGSELCSLVLD